MHARDLSDSDLELELTVRTIQSHRRDIPTSFVALICRFASLLDTRQRLLLASVLHEVGDELEKTEFVGENFRERFSPTSLAKDILAEAETSFH
jgi:hypothetical protein